MRLNHPPKIIATNIVCSFRVVYTLAEVNNAFDSVLVFLASIYDCREFTLNAIYGNNNRHLLHSKMIKGAVTVEHDSLGSVYFLLRITFILDLSWCRDDVSS
jgi:hypothetical protein